MQRTPFLHKGCLLRKCRACRLYWQLASKLLLLFWRPGGFSACKIRVGKQHGSVDKADRNLRLASSSIHERRKPDQVQGGH